MLLVEPAKPLDEEKLTLTREERLLAALALEEQVDIVSCLMCHRNGGFMIPRIKNRGEDDA